MPNDRPSLIVGSVAFKLLQFFANSKGMPGATVGDLIVELNLHPGTAVHQRMTLDLIHKGWKILHYQDERGAHLYWMPWSERRRAKVVVKELIARKAAQRGKVAA